MVTRYTTKGFVFKKEDRLETDRIFSVFTHDFGRIEVFAKAIRKIDAKLMGGIEVFSLSEIEFIQGKNRKTLTDAIFIQKSRSIFENPEKIEIAQKICDLLDASIRGEESDKKIWEAIEDFLQKLSKAPPDAHLSLLYPYFFWNFASVLGYAPELSICLQCEQRLRPNVLYFSYKEGGIVCASCHHPVKEEVGIAPDIIKILRLMLQKDWRVLVKLKIGESLPKDLEQVSEGYCQYLLDSHFLRASHQPVNMG